MTEEQLNENLIKSELQCICQDCIYLDKIVPIIRKMLSEEYKTGLEQSRFDKNMLEQENQELKKQLKEINTFINNSGFANIEQVMLDFYAKMSQQKEFIEWLENEISNLTVDENKISSCSVMPNRFMKSCFEKTLSKYKEIIGVRNE